MCLYSTDGYTGIVAEFSKSVGVKGDAERYTCGGPHADHRMDIARYISAQVRELYDVYSYQHAAAILTTSFPQEWVEIEQVLLDFRMTMRDVGTPGGNESDIPKKYSRTLRLAG